MIERRDLLRGVAVGTVLASAHIVSACSYAEYEDDDWGGKLIAFFQSGETSRLDNLFRDFSTLVTFDTTFGLAPHMLFEGAAKVRQALVDFRTMMTGKGWVEARKLADAKIVGNKQQGRMSRIELLFAEGVTSNTSCGPDRSERRAHLYYQAGVYETGDDWVKWGIERLAFLPPLALERFDG
ncbi:MAG: hypothetical protein ACREBO_05320 [Novosphingobium sp.]